MIQVFAVVLLAVGLVGYVLSLILVWAFRFWMRGRGAGWPRILFNVLMVLLHVLAILFFSSLLGNLGVRLGRTLGLAVNFGVAGLLAAAPWYFVAALWRWWYPSAEMPPLVLTPHHKDDED